MVYRSQLTYEVIDKLDLKYNPTKRIGYSLRIGIYEVIDLNDTSKYILPENVKASITIDDVTLKTNLKIIQTLIFTEKSFLYYTGFYSIIFLSSRRYR